ncbi:hypothetical protein D915_004584 [Fasciola hepatica]|uniref:Uncharacterized protein n=1 Tax=Fasciola hepatica TaxID=6192 RepID=A0A4E0RDN2_FASHE|nr:hypothetical protein D915_004584 [Fasciola hepatica]
MLSQFKNLFSPAPAADGDHVSTAKAEAELNSLAALKKSEEMNSTNAGTIENTSKAEPKTPHSDALTSLVWLSQFSTQCAKLEDLIEDTGRFQSMVDRLTDITRRAHLSQATGFLIDISTRFGELQKSFDSLKESYQDIRSEKEMPDELRAAQLTGLQDFLVTLDRNLESTKECFFTIYHLVKSTVEQGVADGSLREALSDTEDEPQRAATNRADSQLDAGQEQEREQSRTAEKIGSENPIKPDLSGLSANDTLDAQKAYLAALQDKTASEQEEIARLLRQRDELASRLDRLKAAAAAATQNVNSTSFSDTATEEKQKASEAESLHTSSPEPDLEPIMLAHLKAKKLELAQLKAQLELFHKAEERMAALQLDDQTAPEVEIPKSCVVKAGSRGRQLRSHRPSPPVGNTSFKARFLDSPTNDNDVSTSEAAESEVQTLDKLDSVTFQQPEVTCVSDNTERLYENMREARIRLEEQRSHRTVGTSAPCTEIAAVLAGTGKAILSGGAASVATSQDRTTLATWGGSSSTGSSSASNSIDGPDEEATAVTITSTPQVLTGLTNGIGPSPETITDNRTSERRSNSRRALSDRQSRSSKTDPYVSGVGDLLDPSSLPQLGRSPSPPGATIIRASKTTADFVGGSQQTETSLDGDSPTKAGVSATTIGTDKEFDYSTYYSALAERTRRLEASLSYLYHVCRNLMLQNSQLHVAVGQLLSDARIASMAVQPQSNPLASLMLPHSTVFPTSRTVLQSPVSQSVVLPNDAASTVSSVQATNRFVPPSIVSAESRPKPLSTDDMDMMQQQLALHQLLQQQTQKMVEMEQLLQHFSQHKSVLPGNRGSVPAPMGSSLSSQLISPAAESAVHPSTSLLAQQQQQAYSLDASCAFGLTQPATVLTAQQLPYRTASVPSAGTGLLQTSIATWPNEFYAGLKPTPLLNAGFGVPSVPNLPFNPCASLLSPQSLCVATSRAAPVMNPGSGHVDLFNQVWISPGSTVSGHGPV